MRTPLISILLAAAGAAFAQGNYEVQVYGSELTPKGSTMVELHSNFTAKGLKRATDGTWPSHHALHETLEVTHGFSEWFELGAYSFNSVQPGGGWGFVGAHLRPRVSVPQRYGLPVGLSLSSEIGYQRAQYSLDTWTLELRPIIDKQIGKTYLAFNPTMGRSFHGPGVADGLTFEPAAKASYAVTGKVAAGLEYYGGYGSFHGFSPLREQEHNFLPAIDLDLSEKWEFNFGVGWGVTQATDRLLVKAIVGYRFDSRKR